MIILKSIIHSLNYLMYILDDFTKPHNLLITVINFNIYKIIFNILQINNVQENLIINLYTNNFINIKNNFENKFLYFNNFEKIYLNSFFNYFYFNNVYFKEILINNKLGIFIFNFIFNLFLFTIFFLFFFNFFCKIKKILNNTNFILQKFSKENDQEITSFEDILIFLIFFISFFINIFNLTTTKELIINNYYLSLWFLFVFFFSLIILVPTSILFSAGSNFLLYLKGVEKINSLISYLIADFIAILAFFLRFFLQVIRWCLFLITYYLLHEFIFEWLYDIIINNYLFLYFKNTLFLKLNNNVIIQIIIHFLRFSFELFDTCLILLIQITAFIAVILWLFNFLFSLSIEDIYENNNYNKKC